ncbi:MAG: hypothetical protein IAA85_01745 [Firmicutes bacterium]|nr:hypothetical protein [Candidatus Alectryobacillus merdavium]
MKSKRMLICLLALFATSISSCGEGDTSSTNSNNDDNTSYIDTTLNTTDDSTTGTSIDVGVDEDKDYSGVPATNVTIHYHADNGNYTNMQFYVWGEGTEGEAYNPTGSDDFGIYFTFNPAELLPNANQEFGFYFLMKIKDTWNGKSADTEVAYDTYKPYWVDGVSTLEIWCVPGKAGAVDVFTNQKDALGDKLTVFKINDTMDEITLEASNSIKRLRVFCFDASYYKLSESGRNINSSNYAFYDKRFEESDGVKSLSIPIEDFKFNCVYEAWTIFYSSPNTTKRTSAETYSLYDSEEFQAITYDGDDLGVTFNKEKTTTTFKVWAPNSALVRLNLYTKGNSSSYETDLSAAEIEEYDTPYRRPLMEIDKNGVWSYTFDGYLHGQYYTYTVSNFEGEYEVVDPYAKSAGLNGQRGMIVDFDHEDTKVEEFEALPLKWDQDEVFDIESSLDLTISENHIRDLTMDESWSSNEEDKKLAGTFLGFAKSGTTYTEGETTVKTGFDHLEELGVNAIQILPFFDQDNVEINSPYNWGYNPLNYNVLEGSYSTNPRDGLVRIREFKQLVAAYANNDNHTRIIMDVVYNHVSSAPNSNFQRLVPYYYFRMSEDFMYMDGSACGNEFASETKMGSKFIVDSVTFWAETYKIKGFRFDLMGLISKFTMQKVAEALYEIDPDIVIYGEAWTADGSWKPEENAVSDAVYQDLYPVEGKSNGVGAFNDAGRDALKGNNNAGGDFEGYPGWGFISQGGSDLTQDKVDRVTEMLKGGNYGKGGNPRQTINYASCHDNYTLFDQLNWTLASSTNNTPEDEPDIETVARASVAVNGAILMSNGVAFINGGEEIFRTKIEDNEKPTQYEVNMFGKRVTHNSYTSSDYTNSYKYDRKVQLYEYFEMYKELIEIRKQLEPVYFPENYDNSELISVWDNTASNHSIALYRKGKDGSAYHMLLSGRAENVYINCAEATQIFTNGSDAEYVLGEDGSNRYLLKEMYSIAIIKA